MSSQKYILYIFHRDLRLFDNQTLRAAVEHARRIKAKILPAFIFTPAQISPKANPYKSDNAVQFMVASLEDLDKQIKNSGGSGLNLFHGDHDTVLWSLLNSLQIAAVYETADYTPFAKQRQEQTLGMATLSESEAFFIHDTYLTEPGVILNKSGKPFQKFTPFYETVRTARIPKPQPTPRNIPWASASGTTRVALPREYKFSLKEAHSLYKANPEAALRGGRQEGERLLAHLPKRYSEEKDTPSIPTSYLSAHHHFGTVSIRETYHTAMSLPNHQESPGSKGTKATGSNTSHQSEFVRQLYWRDFYGHITAAFEELYKTSPYTFQKDRASAKGRWSYDQAAFQRWAEGRTGVPIVDAAMKQMLQTGWMHNRGRLIVANYLVKKMKVFWRWGEEHFARHLIDYDFAQNFGNWSWIASVLPYSQAPFRTLDPEIQQKKFDPDNTYVSKWLPEAQKGGASAVAEEASEDYEEDNECYNDANYIDIDTIIEELDKQEGGAYSKSSPTFVSSKIKQQMISLGWRKDFIEQRFGKLIDQLVGCWVPHLFIRDYHEKIAKRLTVHQPLNKSFLEIGLMPNVATHLSQILEPLDGNSYSRDQVINLGVKYLLGDYTPTTSPETKFLHAERQVDKWLSLKYKQRGEEGIERTLPIYNLSNINNFIQAVSIFNIPCEKNKKLFYHTTSWGGANSIMQKINRNKGRTCLDFGLTPGFYMSESPNVSMDWARAKQKFFSGEVATFIFALPQSEQYPATLKYRIIEDPYWSQVTKYSRLCQKGAYNENDHDYIYDYDLLYGDMVSNPNAVKYSGKDPKPHKQPMKQLVSKSDAADKFIQSCLVGCVFYQKA